MKQQIKMFKTECIDELEEAINDFIQDKCVYDIQYTLTVDPYGYPHYTAMVFYCKEETNNE